MNKINLAPAILATSQSTAHVRARETSNAKMPVQQDSSLKDPNLWKVSLQFESMMIRQMMSAMRKTVPESGLLSSGFASDMYISMFDQAIAETCSKKGSMSIAENIYRQMNSTNYIKANAISADMDIDRQSARLEE